MALFELTDLGKKKKEKNISIREISCKNLVHITKVTVAKLNSKQTVLVNNFCRRQPKLKHLFDTV